MIRSVHKDIGGKTLTIETGELAGQADGSVTVQYGDTLVLITACVADQVREGIDFLPLTVDFEERLYAAGKIPGSFFRREGRPSQEATLSCRLIDRSIRPLFPKGFKNEIQVICTVLSADQENQPDILSIIGASAAVAISKIPFSGPIGACRIGYIDGSLVVNPTFTQLQSSQLDLVVTGTKDAVVMVEAGAREVSEELVIEAVEKGQEINQQVIALIEEMVRAVATPKMEFSLKSALESDLQSAVAQALHEKDIESVLEVTEKAEKAERLAALGDEVGSLFQGKYPSEEIAQAFESQVREEIRSRILREGKRPDGRAPTEIRPISIRVGLLPRTHGSGLFNRGQTQVLTIVTLGSVGEMQKLDTLGPEEKKRYIHHYNFPPFSTGEVKRVGSPGRREVGHGALAERALMPVIPGEEEFPYTMRLVSEAISSNGSTSMASVCGSTLALMDAGVPIKAPVAGVAMGLVMGEDNSYRILTDIQGIEDHLGDMDFKVAGTSQGVTALQMDLKVKGISYQIMEKALAQAREGRMAILEKIREAIPEVKAVMSPYAPRMTRIQIPIEKIGAVIGPGGKTIRSIIEETKATIDVRDDGSVFIGSPNGEAALKAKQIIESMTKDVEIGAVYTGKVVRIMSFGAFVEILPGKDGLVHISELSDRRIENVEDEVSVGDEITVIVKEIDRMGRINLSRKALFEPAEGATGAEEGSDGGRSAPPSRPESDRPSYRSPGPSRAPRFQQNPGSERRPGSRPPGSGGFGPRRDFRG